MTPSQIYNDNDLIRQRNNLMPKAVKLREFWKSELKKVCRQLDNYKPAKPLQK